MEKRYYGAAGLRVTLDHLEHTYGLSSDDFYAAYLDDKVPATIPGYHRHVWASFYRDVKRLEGTDFSESARRVLAFG